MRSLTSLDIYFLVQELQVLVNSKVDKISQLDYKDFLFSFHKPSFGKIILRVTPNILNISTKKESSSLPNPFIMQLRKYLTSSFLISITQKEFERIIELKLRKDKEYTLIIEMFGKGNIILVSEGKIISCLESQSFSARKVAPHETYSYPPSRFNILSLTFKDFKDLVNSSDKESIVKILAIDFSFGGIYSEEILSPLSIKKDKKILNDSELKGLYERINQILKKQLSPVLINNDPFPFNLGSLVGEKVEYDSFSLALDSFTSTKAKTSFDKRLKQVIELKEIQINKIKELEEESIQFKEIGDLIYNNYSLIDNLIKQIKETKWKYNDDIIKEKNAKESKVVIEL